MCLCVCVCVCECMCLCVCVCVSACVCVRGLIHMQAAATSRELDKVLSVTALPKQDHHSTPLRSTTLHCTATEYQAEGLVCVLHMLAHTPPLAVF